MTERDLVKVNLQHEDKPIMDYTPNIRARIRMRAAAVTQRSCVVKTMQQIEIRIPMAEAMKLLLII